MHFDSLTIGWQINTRGDLSSDANGPSRSGPDLFERSIEMLK